MSRYGYRSISESPLEFEITSVDCIYIICIMLKCKGDVLRPPCKFYWKSCFFVLSHFDYLMLSHMVFAYSSKPRSNPIICLASDEKHTDKQYRPDQTSQKAASDKGLHWFH